MKKYLGTGQKKKKICDFIVVYNIINVIIFIYYRFSRVVYWIVNNLMCCSATHCRICGLVLTTVLDYNILVYKEVDVPAVYYLNNIWCVGCGNVAK